MDNCSTEHKRSIVSWVNEMQGIDSWPGVIIFWKSTSTCFLAWQLGEHYEKMSEVCISLPEDSSWCRPLFTKHNVWQWYKILEDGKLEKLRTYLLIYKKCYFDWCLQSFNGWWFPKLAGNHWASYKNLARVKISTVNEQLRLSVENKLRWWTSASTCVSILVKIEMTIHLVQRTMGCVLKDYWCEHFNVRNNQHHQPQQSTK